MKNPVINRKIKSYLTITYTSHLLKDGLPVLWAFGHKFWQYFILKLLFDINLLTSFANRLEMKYSIFLQLCTVNDVSHK